MTVELENFVRASDRDVMLCFLELGEDDHDSLGLGGV